MIVFHLARLKTACSSSSTITRLVASKMIATRIRDLHTELTFVQQAFDPDSCEATPLDWESQCNIDELALLALFREKIEGELSSELSLADEDSLSEASSLLQHMVRTQGHTCSLNLLELLEISSRKLREASSTRLLSVPKWFIPSHELDLA